MRVKLAVYRAVVRGILLYGCESWVVSAGDLRRLRVFENGCVRRLLGVTRLDRFSAAALRQRTGLEDLGVVLARRRWRWLGHVLRMGEERMPRRVLLACMGALGMERLRGGKKLTWKRLVTREGWRGLLVARRALSWDRWRRVEGWKWLAAEALDRQAWRQLADLVALDAAYS